MACFQAAAALYTPRIEPVRIPYEGTTLPGYREEAERRLRAASDPDLDARLRQVVTQDATARWAINHGMYVMGVDTPAPSAPPTSTTPSATASPNGSAAPRSCATPPRTSSSGASPSSSTTT